MAASYPGQVKNWAPLQGAGNKLELTHVNDLYEEVIAIETDLRDNSAKFKNGNDSFTLGETSYTVTDAFITANTLVIVSPTSIKVGDWSVESSAGSFTITSSDTETIAVDFDWAATKGV